MKHNNRFFRIFSAVSLYVSIVLALGVSACGSRTSDSAAGPRLAEVGLVESNVYSGSMVNLTATVAAWPFPQNITINFFLVPDGEKDPCSNLKNQIVNDQINRLLLGDGTANQQTIFQQPFNTTTIDFIPNAGNPSSVKLARSTLLPPRNASRDLQAGGEDCRQ